MLPVMACAALDRMGIASALFTDIDGPDTFASAYVSLFSYRNWIDDTLMARLGDDQLALWVSTPMPEPATWLMWLAGASLLASRVKRKA